MGSHGSISTEMRLRADDFKHLIRPKYVKGLTRSDVLYARPMFGSEPLHGQEILVIAGRFRHHIDGSGSLLSNSWEALTYDLAAIYGTIDDSDLKFLGVTTHLFDRFLNRPTQGNDASHQLFVLGPGELVRGIDICWRDLRVVGLRLQTNQRQSQWFGRRHGVVKSVTAPQGYFINAIEDLFNKTARWELGLRLCPVIDHHLMRGIYTSLTAQEKSPRVGSSNREGDGVQTEFAEMHDEVRAVVVKCGAKGGIADLHVLSPEMYGRHLAKREEPLPRHEHIFFLRHSEYILEVEVHASATVKALRFRTNLTKSAWYGKLAGEKSDDESAQTSEPQRFVVPEKTMQVCGFHGTFGASTLSSLGVFYGAIATPQAGDASLLPSKSVD